jgi:hypothetical protein
VKVSRVKSSTREKAIAVVDESTHQQQEENLATGSLNVIRVTRVPSHSTSAHTCRPSIVENTIRLDETKSSKKNKNIVRVKHVRSAHRSPAIQHHLSQVDTIELPANHSKLEPSSPSVRVKRIRTGKNKLKSARSIAPFELIDEETAEQQNSDAEFGVIVERILREKSTKSIK